MTNNFAYFRRRFSKSIRRPYIRISALFALCIIIVSTLLLSMSTTGKMYHYNIGDIAGEDVIVPHDIRYQLETETRRNMEKAAERTPLVFDKDQAVLAERLATVAMISP